MFITSTDRRQNGQVQSLVVVDSEEEITSMFRSPKATTTPKEKNNHINSIEDVAKYFFDICKKKSASGDDFKQLVINIGELDSFPIAVFQNVQYLKEIIRKVNPEDYDASQVQKNWERLIDEISRDKILGFVFSNSQTISNIKQLGYLQGQAKQDMGTTSTGAVTL